MESDGRGPLLYAYRPIPANPMTVAVLLLVLVVTLVIGPIVAAPEGLWPLGGFCFLPLAVVLLAVALFKPSATRVFEDGIEVSLPLWRRLAASRRYVSWSEIRDIYPRAYEVAGSFLSPFASSAGTLVHTGIGIETREGRRILLKFTPGSIRAFRADTQGYLEAMAVIRDRFTRRGERMVTTSKSFSDAEVLAMQSRAREPLLRIEGVFTAFFLPPSVSSSSSWPSFRPPSPWRGRSARANDATRSFRTWQSSRNTFENGWNPPPIASSDGAPGAVHIVRTRAGSVTS